MKILSSLLIPTLIIVLFSSLPARGQSIKVFILAGQSNAQGHGDINPATTPGTLAHFIANDSSTEFEDIQDSNGNWISRPDVWVRYDHEWDGLLTGNLGVGYGGWSGQIGPELGMGHVLGDYFGDQILIIKTCWGGKNLAVDFRPPSSGGDVGPYYTQMIHDIQSAISNIATEFPAYNGEAVEIAGFVWFQGWNDAEQTAFINEYESNLINLIADIRSDLNVPNLPMVLGLTGNGGYTVSQVDWWIQQLQTLIVPAQINAAESPVHQNVAYAETRDFWRASSDSPFDAAHHWHNNGESYLRIGHAFGMKMIELLETTTRVENGNQVRDNLRLFPCPVTDFIELSGFETPLDIHIFSASGHLLLVLEDQMPHQKIDVSALPPGVYLMSFHQQQDAQRGFRKFIKM